MRVDLEQRIGRLSGGLVPPEVKLPAQYAHFGEHDAFLDSLSGSRDQFFYNTALDAYWVGLCVSIDRIRQAELLANLKTKLGHQLFEQHAAEIRSYWEALSNNSTYHLYQRVVGELENDRFGPKVVSSWRYQKSELFDISSELQQQSISPKNAAITEFYTAAVYPFINNKPLFNEAWGEGENARNLNQHVLETAGEDLLGYVGTLQILLAARTISLRRLRGEINKQKLARIGKIRLDIPDLENYIRRMARNVLPYRYTSTNIVPIIEQKEKELFGGNTPFASALWRAVVFLRIDAMPKGISVTSVRNPIVDLVVKGAYEEAKVALEQQAAIYPGILPQFALSDLDIDPTTLRQLGEEGRRETGMNARMRTRMERAKERKLAEGFIGKRLVSPDGKYSIIIEERLARRYDLPILVVKGDWREVLERQRGNQISTKDLFNLVNRLGFKTSED